MYFCLKIREMKHWIFLFVIGFLWVGCEQKQPPKRDVVKEETVKPLVVQESNGKYTEWYPGRKQIKITGRKNEKGEREGIWKYFSEQGVEISVTVYNAGKKDGHIIVKRPNGALSYVGEYAMDEPIGIWKMYNENGELIETKDYSK